MLKLLRKKPKENKTKSFAVKENMKNVDQNFGSETPLSRVQWNSERDAEHEPPRSKRKLAPARTSTL